MAQADSTDCVEKQNQARQNLTEVSWGDVMWIFLIFLCQHMDFTYAEPKPQHININEFDGRLWHRFLVHVLSEIGIKKRLLFLL